MSNTLLTIFITVFNKDKFQLVDAINSCPKDALVYVDIDGGWDCTPCRYENLVYLLNHDLIKFRYNQENKGLAKLRNEEIELCETKYMQFMDADDTLKSVDLGIMKSSISFDLMVSIVEFSNESGITDDNRNLYVGGSCPYTYFVIPSLIFKTEFLLSHTELRFSTNVKVFEDVVFSVRLTLMEKKVRILNEPYYVYNYTDSGTNLTSSSNDDKKVVSTITILNDLSKLRSDYNEYQSLSWIKIYIRMQEEANRLFSFKLTKYQIDEVTDLMKPHHFFKNKTKDNIK